MVVSAGMPRAGSTMQDRLLRQALAAFGLKPGVAGYWNWHWHAGKLSLAERLGKLHNTSKRLRGLSTDAVVIMKTHEFDPRVLQLCDRSLVFTLHRHPLEMLISAAGEWHRGNMRERKAIDFLARAIHNHECWHRYAVEETANAELRSNPSAVLARYVRKIGVHLYGEDYSARLVHTEDMGTLAKRAKGNPSSHAEASPNMLGMGTHVFCKFHRWMLLHDYSIEPQSAQEYDRVPLRSFSA